MYGISLYVQYKTVLVQCVDGKTLPSKDLPVQSQQEKH